VTDGHIVAIATAAGLLAQGVGPSFRYLAGARLARKKLTLQTLAARQTDVEASYGRLERENQRLTREVADLRTALSLERSEHEETRGKLERITERCDQCERWMRIIGRRGDLPDPPLPMEPHE